MTSCILPGQEIHSRSAEVTPVELRGAIQVIQTYETLVSSSREGGDQDRTLVKDIDETDIVEIQLRNGLKLWQSVADARQDFATADRSEADQSLLIPRVLPIRGTQSRAGGDYAVHAVRILKAAFTGKAGEMSAVAVAQHIEKAIKPGLYRCERSVVDGLGSLVLVAQDLNTIPVDKPFLVLIHGTFSSTQGSFADLAGPPYPGMPDEGVRAGDDLWTALEKAFPGGILALEHKSVTVDPITNALDLVTALPKGARVTLLSHSRGGLVAELVARASRLRKAGEGAFDETDRKILTSANRDTKALDKLTSLIATRDLRVERLIRVAGPLRGTPLASERLDRVLSIALNTFELLPPLKASVAYSLLKSFLLAFVKTKANPEELPGLEAMMPTSPLVKMVNRIDVRFGGDLHVIAGDNDGSGLLQRLRNLAVDLFFQDDNDFVVNFASMNRGSAARKAPTVTPVVSANITHFNYFRTEMVRSAIISAARSEPARVDAEALAKGLPFEPVPDELDLPRSRAASKLPVCILLPGIMGSHLRHNDQWIWLNPVRVAAGELSRLKMPGSGVKPGKMMDRYYGDLARYLSQTHDVILFPYDWRESVLLTGSAALAATVKSVLATTDQPIRFMAHSMGGLVVRAFIDTHPALWSEVTQRRGSRFVMLGTPNGGAFSMVHTLFGRAKSIQQLETLDIANSMKELLGIVTSMPGPAQLLPSDAQGHYLKRQTWVDLHSLDTGNWVVPPEETLRLARSAHDRFAQQTLDPKHALYVAGMGKELTISSLKVDTSAPPKDRVKFFGTRAGDGTVTWATGIPAGIDTYYMNAVHGDLARTRSAFPALLDLLERGESSALSKTPPTVSRGAATGPEVVPDVALDIYPDGTDVLDSFIGASTGEAVDDLAPVHRTSVTLVHGDLSFARHPVLVGHYLGDPINGGEAALDRSLDGHLSHVRDMGLYPGAIETCEVVLRLDRNPGGAVIAGLGRFGDLTPGQLRATINRAILRYVIALQRMAMDDGKSLADINPIALTTLLVGHKGANMNVRQSVDAILEAVAEANQVLKETPIAHLEFVELYEDTTFKAASALHRASLHGQAAGSFHFDRKIRTGHGARLRMDYGTEADSWQRITVSRSDDQTLNYTVISDGAKAAFKKTAFQVEVINTLLKESRVGTATQRNLGKLLFELLIPIDLKDFAKNDQKIQLLVDETTAHIPWELMEDDVGTFSNGLYQSVEVTEFKPLVIRAPIIRRLVDQGTSVPRAQVMEALVVGDPKTSLPPLEGARKEAQLVADILERRAPYKVHALIQPESGISVLEAALLRPSKIMHFATHGFYDDSKPTSRAGLVLSDGIHLTSAEIEQMRYVPEFVFLNCCHVGRVEVNTGLIAASLSQALIRKGVRAVIAAGWAVDDAAAHHFAQEFYDSFLNGNSFGDAVYNARLAVFRRYSDKNTWGAYQCYGDPDYRLDEQAEGARAPGQRAHYYSADHAWKAAVNIATDVRNTKRHRNDMVAELDAIAQCAGPDWDKNARWCEAMGRAYARLDVLAPATDFLERAIRNSRSRASIHCIELLEELTVRAAAEDWAKAEAAVRSANDENVATKTQLADVSRKTLQSTAAAALQTLRSLDSVIGGGGSPATTVRREVLKGTVLKRLVLASRATRDRKAALKRMVGQYRSASELAAAQGPASKLKPHPTFNWFSGQVALGELDIDGQPIETWFKRLEEENAVLESASPSFWTAVLPAEIDILRGLVADRADRTEIFNRFERTFRAAWNRGGAYSQARSIREHLHFLSTSLEQEQPDKVAWIERALLVIEDVTGFTEADLNA